MEVKYTRTVNGSFMLLEGEPHMGGFEEKMLKENDVPKLLPFYTLELNDSLQYWYDISKKRAFRDLILTGEMSAKRLYRMFYAIKEAIAGTSKYLIDENNLYLTEDTIFFEERGQALSAWLCFCPIPHEDQFSQLGSLTRFLIEEVDHKDKKLTTLCYELNAITEREEFSFSDIMERLEEEGKFSVGYNLSEERAQKAEIKPMPYDEVDRRIAMAGVDIDFQRTGAEEYMDVPEAGEKRGFDLSDYEESLQKEKKREKKKKKKEKKTKGFNIKEKIRALMPRGRKKKQKLLPDRNEGFDIEFDKVEEVENATVLLSEDKKCCRGRFIYESGGRGGRDFEIVKNPFMIGSRSGGNDAVISSEAVSRYHARITKYDGGFFIEDLNSTNGTFVNGELLPYHSSYKLKSMDMVSFADVVYRVI